MTDVLPDLLKQAIESEHGGTATHVKSVPVALLQAHIDTMLRDGLPIPADRALLKWKRSLTPEIGAVMVASVNFPAKYMRLDRQIGASGKPLIVFELGPTDEAAQIGFFYSREAAETLEPKFLQIGKPLFTTHLANGDKVWMVARTTDFDDSIVPTPEQFARAPRLDLGGGLSVGETVSNLNMVLWNKPMDGEPLHLTDAGGVSVVRNKEQVLEIRETGAVETKRNG